MKYRNGFVSNSSSCSFIITNKTNNYKDLYDFAQETIDLVEEFNYEYQASEEEGDFLEDAKTENLTFSPNESRELIFGDDEGTTIGRVFDYMLRDGGESKSFKWKFNEMLR